MLAAGPNRLSSPTESGSRFQGRSREISVPIKVPEAMKPELQRWNSGAGISVEDWIGFVGNADLAVGYSTVFWPVFEPYKGYILTEGWTPETVEGFERQPDSTPEGVEWVLNHRHMIDIHADHDVDPTVEHLVRLGTVLKEIYEAKLAWQFPDRPCEVEFYVPDDPDDLVEYQVSFWQKKWAETGME